MYSKARIAGHAVHPMLVGFPIALFGLTLAAELAFVGTRDVFYYRAAMVANVAGLVGALAAIVPGSIDLLALPKGSRARGVGVQHALWNLVTVALFAVSAALLYRGWSGRTMVEGAYDLDATIPLAVDTIGFVSLVIAASLGWSLVQTHHIGIKPAMTYATRPSREPDLRATDELDGVLADLSVTPAPRQYGRPAHITLH